MSTSNMHQHQSTVNHFLSITNDIYKQIKQLGYMDPLINSVYYSKELDTIIVDHQPKFDEDMFLKKIQQFGLHPDTFEFEEHSIDPTDANHIYSKYKRRILETVKYLIELKGPKLTDIISISWAIEYGNLNIVQNLTSEDIINWGCRNGYIEIVQYLIEDKQICASSCSTDWAIKYGHFKILRYLLRGPDIETKFESHINIAIDNGRVDIAQYLEQEYGIDIPDDAVYRASKNGYLELVNYLIQLKIRTDEQEQLIREIQSRIN